MIENIWVWLKLYPFIILLLFVIIFLANPKISPILKFTLKGKLTKFDPKITKWQVFKPAVAMKRSVRWPPRSWPDHKQEMLTLKHNIRGHKRLLEQEDHQEEDEEEEERLLSEEADDDDDILFVGEVSVSVDCETTKKRIVDTEKKQEILAFETESSQEILELETETSQEILETKVSSYLKQFIMPKITECEERMISLIKQKDMGLRDLQFSKDNLEVDWRKIIKRLKLKIRKGEERIVTLEDENSNNINQVKELKATIVKLKVLEQENKNLELQKLRGDLQDVLEASRHHTKQLEERLEASREDNKLSEHYEPYLVGWITHTYLVLLYLVF